MALPRARALNARTGLWWGSLEGADLETLIACAGRAGFTDVSTTPAMYFAARAGGKTDADLRALLDEHGVRVAVIDPLMRGLPGACAPEQVSKRWRATFEHGEDDCYLVAEALNVDLINVAHFLGAPTPLDELIDAIGLLTSRAVARGRSIVIEAMPEGAIADIATADAIARAVNDPHCGLTIDTWHWWRTGGAMDELLKLSPGTVRVLQAGDALLDARGTATNPPSRDRLLPGLGDLPLVDVVRLVQTRHPAACLGIEVFDRATAAQAFDITTAAAAQSMARLTSEAEHRPVVQAARQSSPVRRSSQ